jgi:hypothetical protein
VDINSEELLAVGCLPTSDKRFTSRAPGRIRRVNATRIEAYETNIVGTAT